MSKASKYPSSCAYQLGLLMLYYAACCKNDHDDDNHWYQYRNCNGTFNALRAYAHETRGDGSQITAPATTTTVVVTATSYTTTTTTVGAAPIGIYCGAGPDCAQSGHIVVGPIPNGPINTFQLCRDYCLATLTCLSYQYNPIYTICTTFTVRTPDTILQGNSLLCSSAFFYDRECS